MRVAAGSLSTMRMRLVGRNSWKMVDWHARIGGQFVQAIRVLADPLKTQ